MECIEPNVNERATVSQLLDASEFMQMYLQGILEQYNTRSTRSSTFTDNTANCQMPHLQLAISQIIHQKIVFNEAKIRIVNELKDSFVSEARQYKQSNQRSTKDQNLNYYTLPTKVLKKLMKEALGPFETDRIFKKLSTDSDKEMTYPAIRT